MLLTSTKSDGRIIQYIQRVRKRNAIVLSSTLVSMLIAWFAVDAVLPLFNLYFSSAQLVSLSGLVLLPSRTLLPGFALTPLLVQPTGDTSHITLAGTWLDVALLLAAFVLLFGCYLLALRMLPSRIGMRYILFSTLLIGCLCMMIPVVTSPDIYSYILYARMTVLYHLNPLISTPLNVPRDVVYPYIYWKDQPSAYGPIWLALSALLQWIDALVFEPSNIAVMVLLLRIVGLCSHLLSTMLVWSLGKKLQRRSDINGVLAIRLRVFATLAFAWNPLLLFEACVNAHNDAVMLLLILLSLWVLVSYDSLRSYAFVAILLALATCVKVNVVVLLPGILLYACFQPRRVQVVACIILAYGAVLLLAYAPFWDAGAILRVLTVNPGTVRNENSLPDFITQVFNALLRIFNIANPPDIGSVAEHITHTLSLCLFALSYVALLLWVWLRRCIATPQQLISWMACAWLLYCMLGSPWFWPWYAVTFFGLFALTEMERPSRIVTQFTKNVWFLFLLLFAFTLLSSYCFVAWGLYNSYVPLLQGFRWAFWRGLWIWLPILLLLFVIFRRRTARVSSVPQEREEGYEIPGT